jgi:hypothetical protein
MPCIDCGFPPIERRRLGTIARSAPWERGRPARNERFSANNRYRERRYHCDLVGHSMALTLNVANRHLLGPRASLPASSASAREIFSDERYYQCNPLVASSALRLNRSRRRLDHRLQLRNTLSTPLRHIRLSPTPSINRSAGLFLQHIHITFGIL